MRNERGEKNMSRLMGKRVRIGKYFVPALLLISLAVGTVAAVAYVVLTWTISLTVAPNPRVHFWDGSTAANTMTITMGIFPSIRTIDEDAAWDIRSVTAGNIYIRVSTMDTSDVTQVKIKAYNATATLFDVDWSTSTTTWSGPFLTATGKDYNLWIEVQAASSPTGPASISVDLKVESP